jgi:hypothetical protein
MPTEPKPLRQIQSAEILSRIFPPGATIVIDDEDEVVPYTGRLHIVPTVHIMRRAGAGLATDDDNDNNNGHDNHDDPPSRHDSPDSIAYALPASQSTLSSQSSISYPPPRSTRAIPRAPTPPSTIANTASRAASPAPFDSSGPSRVGDDTWVYRRSAYVVSPTVAMSSPERSPERPPLSALPHNNSSQQFTSNQASGSQPSLSQLPVSYQQSFLACY